MIILIILLSLFPSITDRYDYEEPILRDTIELRFFAETFYAYPPGEGRRDVHSIDVDSVCFICKHRKYTYSSNSVFDSVHRYLWLKYQQEIFNIVRTYSDQYPYQCQRTKWVGMITLLPGGNSSDATRMMQQLSHRLSRKKWQRIWNLSYLSPKQLSHARNWVLGHISSESMKSDSLFVVECFHPNTPRETIYTYNPRNQEVNGWIFPQGNNTNMPEPILTDKTTLEVIQSFIIQHIEHPYLFNCEQGQRPRLSKESIYEKYYTILLLISHNSIFYPSYYDLYIDSPFNEFDLWML